MAAPFPLPDVCNIHRPAGASSPVHSDVPCRIVPNLAVGRGGTAGPTYLMWTHWVDLPPDYDIRDGCTRAAGTNYITYADGDGVRAVCGGFAYRWVVVWVEDRFTNTDTNYTRAYLVRDVRSPA